LAGKQKLEWERHADYPLAHEAKSIPPAGHVQRSAAQTETAALATEGHKIFDMAGVAMHPQSLSASKGCSFLRQDFFPLLGEALRKDSRCATVVFMGMVHCDSIS